MQHEDPSHVLSQNERLAYPSPLSPQAAEVRSSAPDNAGILFGKYVRYVAKIGGTILGRSDEVDDVIQDVFLAVHHDLHNLRDPECTKAWIATIAVRVSRQRLAERITRRRISEIPPFEIEALAAPHVSVEHRVDLTHMLRVIRDLPPLFRSAWLLKYVDNQPLERIAELSNCSMSTAQRRIRAAELGMRGAVVVPPSQARRRSLVR